LVAIKPRKRRRVDKDPNTGFTGIKQIRKAQEAAGAVEIVATDSSEDGESSDADSCFEVAVVGS
jgi:hypothetical protein